MLDISAFWSEVTRKMLTINIIINADLIFLTFEINRSQFHDNELASRLSI